LKTKRKSADNNSRIYFEEAKMKQEKGSKHALQPECKTCRRFAILKSPCAPESCMFRVELL
jgi:hypothetical protein